MYKTGVFIIVFVAILGCNPTTVKKKDIEIIPEPKVVVPRLHFGIDLNQYDVVENIIQRNDTFGAILMDNGFDFPQIYSLIEKIKKEVQIKKLRYGKPYSIFYSKDKS